MNITFLGVGEACDPANPNTSCLIEAEADQKADPHYILFDCGFTTPHRYFRLCSHAESLEALWISHFHGDHFFGVPLLLLRFQEMERKKPLHILGQTGVREKVEQALDLAYPGFGRKLRYPLHYHAVEPGRARTVAGCVWQTAENTHSQRCLSVRITAGRSVFYSGDGRPTEESLELARGCDLVIHEAFRLEQDTPGHGSVAACLDFARKAEVKALALVHVERDERRHRQEEIVNSLRQVDFCHAFLPGNDELFRL